MNEVERLYNAIINVVDFDDIDKENLFESLHHISEKQFLELEAIYIYKHY